MSASNGRFVWFDLMTNDVEGAREFYGELVGWKTRPMGGSSNYDVWTAGEKQLGGVLTTERGSPSYWLGYIATQDVDGAAERTAKMKGRVIVPGTDIPDTGRYAVLADPQGAQFGVYHSNRERPAPDPKQPGHFGWAELNATDWKSAWQFYSELFNWKPTSSIQMGGDLGEDFMFGTDPKTMMGGMSNSANLTRSRPSWLFYLNVKSVDDAVKLVSQSRGTVVNGPMDVPTGERIAECRDPQGAKFGILSRPR